MIERLLLASALALSGTAHAQTPRPVIPTPTHDWGCEVLLCLANPAGPTAASACVPPIRRLWRHLARGRAFPTCAMATGTSGRSYARPAHRYYDPCPDGTTELSWGRLAELAAAAPAAPPATRAGVPSAYVAAASGFTYAGIGSGEGYGYSGGPDTEAPVKVCVGGSRGTREVWNTDSSYSVELYDHIYVAPAHRSPRVIDVYIDEALWHSVRW